MSMYEKIGKFIGGVLAGTIAGRAGLIIIVFTLKCLWFIIFRFLG